MMKTALSIVQDFRGRVGLSKPTTLVGVTDPDEVQMVELLTNALEELRQAQCWVQQKRKHSFDTVVGKRQYPLPRDFYSPVLDTHWNETESLSLEGPLSDAEFAYRLYSGASTSTDYAFRIFGPDAATYTDGGQFVVDPLPAAIKTCSFEYLSRNLYTPRFWTPATVFAAGAYCTCNGQIYQTTAGGLSGATLPTGTGTGISDGAGGVLWNSTNEPYESIIADTDLVIFDYDLVKLGLRGKWYEEHGGSWETASAEFQTKIDQAVARMKRPSRGNMCGQKAGPRYSVPSRGWSI